MKPNDTKSMDKQVLIAAILGSALLLLVMALPLCFGQVLIADDLGEFHLPARAFYARCLATGDAFDWWPDLFGGLYLTGEGQAGTYHPWHWALYRTLPLSTAFGLEVWCHYPFMWIGMFFWLRRRLVRPGAAAFGALVFTFSGFNLLHLVHVNAIGVVAHIPWILWAVDVALTSRDRKQIAWATGALGILTGSQILLGYPQYVWFSLLAEGAYAAWLITGHPSRRRRGIFAILSGNLAGLLVGSVQWLPTVEALGNSVRQTTEATFATWGSLHPLNLVQLVAPYLFQTRVVGQNTHELGLYIGAVPLVLVAWLLVASVSSRRLRLPPSKRRLALFGVLLATGALILAFGRFGYVAHLQSYLPVVGKFRFPCRMIVLFHLAFAILSAVALLVFAKGLRERSPGTSQDKGQASRASRKVSRHPSLSCHAVGCWLVGASVASVVVARFAWPEQCSSWPRIVAGPLLLAVAVWLMGRVEHSRTWALPCLVLLTAFDLGLYGLSYTGRTGVDSLASFRRSVAQPEGPPTGRVLADVGPKDRTTAHVGNAMLLAGWSRIDGYAGLRPRQQLDYRGLQALRVAGVQWRSIDPRPVRPAREPGPHATLRPANPFQPLPNPLPWARLVTDAIVCDRPADRIEQTDVARSALVDRPLDLPSGTPGSVTVLDERPASLTLDTDADTRQLLLLAHRFHRSWHATIDGRPVEVIPTYGDFMGCIVPAGSHRVQFVFRPASREIGMTLSLCGLSLIVCGFLATYSRQSTV